MSDRANNELARSYHAIATAGTPVFEYARIQQCLLTYDWDLRIFHGGYLGMPEPDEVMRPPDDPRMSNGAGERVPRRPVPGSLAGGAEAIPPEEPARGA
jgi:hypothetical protein